MGITIRLLAGGDVYDLSIIYHAHFDHYKRILYEVLLQWLIHTGIGDLNMLKYLGDKEVTTRVSHGFSECSNGILKRSIGALDGWFVHVVCPSWLNDRIRNLTTFFSRKVCAALNVQCIVMIGNRFYGFPICIRLVISL